MAPDGLTPPPAPARPAPAARWEWAVLLVLLVVAGALRFPALDASPPGFFRDELEKGYTALELWHTARHGVMGPDGVAVTAPLPLFIETFQGHDRTSALYQYLSAPIIGTLGLGVFSTRLLAALAGWCAVLLAWGAGRRLMGPAGALIAAAVLATHPTAVLFSRWAQQGALVTPLVLGGFWLLEIMRTAAPAHRRALAAGGALLLVTGAYAYDPARLVVPVLLAAWLACRGLSRREDWKRPEILTLAAVFTAGWVPLVLFTLGTGGGRLGRVGVAGEGLSPVLLGYLSHFSPEFWLASGDLNPRHRLADNGFAGWGGTLLAVAGAAWAVRCAVRRQWNDGAAAAFALAWLLAAPMAAALTRDAPHALRAGLMPAGAALLAGAAAAWLGQFTRLDRKALIAAVALATGLLALDAVRTGRGVLRMADEDGGPWEAGVQPALREALSAHGEVYLAGEAVPGFYGYYALLFAEATEPERFHTDGLAALRARLVPPGEITTLQPGDTYIAPPRGKLLFLDFFRHPVVVYRMEENGAVTVAPPPGGSISSVP